MEYSLELFTKFLNKLAVFDQEVRVVFASSDKQLADREASEKSERAAVRDELTHFTQGEISKTAGICSSQKWGMDSVRTQNIKAKADIYNRLQKCKAGLMLVRSAENSITDKETYHDAKTRKKCPVDITVDEIIDGKINFMQLAYDANCAITDGRKKWIRVRCSELYCTCRYAEEILKREIAGLRSAVSSDRDAAETNYISVCKAAHQKMAAEWETSKKYFDEMSAAFARRIADSREETEKTVLRCAAGKKAYLDRIVSRFCDEFSPREFYEEYERIYALEPSFERYECVSDMPRNVFISTLEYDISSWNFCEYTKEFLDKYYYFIYKPDRLFVPYCAQFGNEFNYLFRFDGKDKQRVVGDACDLGMRLFMMLPPGKVNFTFVDPVSLGESFATFTRLVNVDDRTSEVINGKIWSAPNDIEEKLRIMTDHISNVTQRCLQGKYSNIYEYNKVAEQNAEAYQIIMLMDFPAGLSEQSLRLLEQISASGPKCGVFTVIYRNEAQFSKIPERSQPLVANIENGFQIFDYSEDCRTISYANESVREQKMLWNGIAMPSVRQMDGIIEILKKGIKSADKVVIGIEKVSKSGEEREADETTTRNGIRIPIGLHGANEIQYLTLGVGGSHHALIAGVAGSGKSSLLHTIILQALSQYGPDELRIYLVDFKRGVEFKIYADYRLPAFEVVAIESEREFGYNILKALEREQKIRADRFKRVKDRKIDRIEDYRALPDAAPMPRILVIMDEFHELFSNASDKIGKESAEMMERIVRQGRAFGVHIILASQSYSNVGGLDKSVYDQMAVRIVLKCSKTDASLLLGDGSSDVDQISIDDPGRAIYNSEAGNKEYNSHFRVAFIDPSKHRTILEGISKKTSELSTHKTRILLSSIEDNRYSIFNQFSELEPAECPVLGRIYLGEPLTLDNNLNIDLLRNEHANMLMMGPDSDKARNMFAFAILSLCINYRVKYSKAPEKPFIYLLNCKPLEDSYFGDTLKLLAKELLPEYVRYIHCGDTASVEDVLTELHGNITGAADVGEVDRYFFVFGYQRAEELKSEIKLSQSDDIDSLFNLMPGDSGKPKLSPKELFHIIAKNGAERGVHTVLWQDSFSALEQNDNNIISYFDIRVVFDMTPEEYSRSVGANDVSLLSGNNAIYYNKVRDNQVFRPYQSPDEDWLKAVSQKLK